MLPSLLTLVALLSTAVVGVPLEPRQTAAAFPDPTVDPFYKAPANLSSYKPGDVIRSRSVQTVVNGPDVGASYQLYYRSKTTKQKPDGTVATVFVPKKPASPTRIFSYQSYQDSTTLDCNPSWAFVDGSASQNKAIVTLDTPIYINWALSQGYYVVASDDYGSQSAFIAGRQEGMAVLDGIKATRAFSKLPKESQVALFGYSGGASSTVWATTLAGSYAPDLNIVGAVHGGTPISTRDTFTFLNGGAFSGFAGAGLVGIMNAYPEMNDYILQHVNDDGKKQIAAYRSNNFCLPQVVSTYPFLNFYPEIDVDDPLDQPIPKAVLSQETLLQSQADFKVAVPKFPLLQFHALLDEIVPYQDHADYVKEQCAGGANIQFQTLPIAEHITGELLGIPGSIIFLKQAFEGQTPKVICGTGLPDFSGMLFTSQADEVMGKQAADSIRALNGTKSVFGEVIKF